MPSNALNSLTSSIIQAKILCEFYSHTNTASKNKIEIEGACLNASIACAIGILEGYIENVLVEFVEKSKPPKKPWGLTTQFEYIVKKMTSDLNTPSWEKVRELVISVSGIDPISGWTYTPHFMSIQASKEFFDDALKVRHSFAHGFKTPINITGSASGLVDKQYSDLLICFIEKMSLETDKLLEHELKVKYGRQHGW
ncbi:hypothetical protein [Aeromonas salmonicida]